MKTLIFILFPFFLSAQVIRGFDVEIPCPQCESDLNLIFRATGGIDLTLAIGGGRQYVLHDGQLELAGFKLLADGIEICFDGRKIFFTQNVAYEGSKKYLCSTYGITKAYVD